MSENSRTTWEGCSVLLDINDGDRLVFARLSPGSTLKIGTKNFSLQPLIGCHYGSLFQVENGKKPVLSRVQDATKDNNVEDKGGCETVDESKDNRALIDNNLAQSLTGEDIDSMKSQGATGNEIIEALIANSATFENKTAFSQEKYRLKKQKKYAPTVLVRRPSACSICEAYFKKNPAKIGFLRIDALSLILSMANVHSHSDVLVVDMVAGMLAGSIAERLGGTGSVCNVYLGNSPTSLDIVRIFNFTSETCKRIVQCSVSDLCSSQNATSNDEIQPNDDTTCQEDNHQESMEEKKVEPIPSESEAMDIVTDTNVAPVIRPYKSPKAGEKASSELIKSWNETGFSSLVIAATDADPWNILKQVFPFLSFSAPFVIYHQYLQPLAECMHNLQVEKKAINLQISEPWLREYQVLPSRTHPHMQMSAFGGYILTGTKICGNDQVKLK
ncbi:tRNA (adenine(58)-N(1))-methyltransferase non-catalytic subunit trm6 [Impatiens glandulifera]|uniref:tRNA (adenine(58)-N(1))-methyltransferase non-catalytic subunit trm6 n=1 Tax=Impatiens glandulifera TaxID=253017 RepID=UPI001FB1087B|nr:tRNA (adenine(58)-N(1))-methyltransferase non-catalytic subunit trm6 [Impatiens glandulifera]